MFHFAGESADTAAFSPLNAVMKGFLRSMLVLFAWKYEQDMRNGPTGLWTAFL